jgi:hypothetical protein
MYGKIQLKRRKKTGSIPLVEQLFPPQVIFSHQDSPIRASHISLRFWDKLRLEPISGSKNLKWIALFPSSGSKDLHKEISKWFLDVSVMYHVLQLGKHTPVNLQYRSLLGGMVPIALVESLVDTVGNKEPEDSQKMRSYARAMRQIGIVLCYG